MKATKPKIAVASALLFMASAQALQPEKVTTNGVLTSLVSFNNTNGANPWSELVEGNDGNFYGTTFASSRVFKVTTNGVLTTLVSFTGTGPFNGGYRLWASTDLSLPFTSWTPLKSNSFDSNGNFSYADSSAITNTSRFYQLSVP